MEMLAEVRDLEARLGRTLDGDLLRRAVAVLQDASALVREEVGDTVWTDPATGVTDLTKVPGSVKAVVLRSAERAMRNPEGFSAESSGDYSFQRTGVQMGVYLTDGELRILRRSVGRTGLWTQQVTRDDLGAGDTVWLDTLPGSEPMPVDVYYEGRVTY